MLQILQLLGDKPLAVGQGLLSHVVLGHQVIIAFGHLDVIAEHLIIAHLQALDARALLFPALQGGHHVRPVVDDLPEVVHLPVVAPADKVPLPDGEGQAVVVLIVPDGLLQQGLEVVQAGEFLQESKAPGGRLGQGGRLPRQLGQHRQPVRQGEQVPGVGRAVHHLADEALQVGHPPQGPGQLLPHHAVRRQGGHLVLPEGDGVRVAQGLLDPGADKPVAHGGAGLVQHPQQGALFLAAPDGLGELQGPPGGKVQLQIPLPAPAVHLQTAQVAQVGFLGLFEISRQRPRRLPAHPGAVLLGKGLLSLLQHAQLPQGVQRLGRAEPGLRGGLA